MGRFDCERCGVNVAYHGWPCIAAQINERESERDLIGRGANMSDRSDNGVTAACGPYETPEVFVPTCPCGLHQRPGSCCWCEE